MVEFKLHLQLLNLLQKQSRKRKKKNLNQSRKNLFKSLNQSHNLSQLKKLQSWKNQLQNQSLKNLNQSLLLKKLL